MRAHLTGGCVAHVACAWICVHGMLVTALLITEKSCRTSLIPRLKTCTARCAVIFLLTAHLTTVVVQLEGQGEERMTLVKENSEFREKLKHLLDQFDLQQQQWKQVQKQHDLEGQLAEAKLSQQTEMVKAEASKADAYKRHAEAVSATEVELRGQVAAYSSKFEDFQSTLTKSNEIFGVYKTEMDQVFSLGSSVSRRLQFVVPCSCPRRSRNRRNPTSTTRNGAKSTTRN
jgi:hypothetical protein